MTDIKGRQAGRGRMMREVVYGCGCKAAGDNIAVYCPKHGNPERGRTSLEARCEFLERENKAFRADVEALAVALRLVERELVEYMDQGKTHLSETLLEISRKALARPGVQAVLEGVKDAI